MCAGADAWFTGGGDGLMVGASITSEYNGSAVRRARAASLKRAAAGVDAG